MELNAFDRQTLETFAQYMPFDDLAQFAALCLAESKEKIGRDALNASMQRLCAARLLIFAAGRLYACDEVKLAARGRYWKEAWQEGFWAEIAALPALPAREGEGTAPVIGEEDFARAQKYARQAKNYWRAAGKGYPSAHSRKINFAVQFFCLALMSVIFAAFAVGFAVAGDYDNTFAAIVSFIFIPFAIAGFALWRWECKREKQGENEPAAFSFGRGYAIACLLSCALHAAFFAALIPFAWQHAVGLALIVVVTALLIWLYLFARRKTGDAKKDKKPKKRRKTRPLAAKLYRAKEGAFTRCAQYYMDGVDVLSTENASPAEGNATATLNIFGHVKKAELYKINGQSRVFYVAVVRHKGVTFIGFPRGRDRRAIYANVPKEDIAKNDALEKELLAAYAESERERAENAVFSYSADGLVRGFVCIQGEFYCARVSAPFFQMPASPPQEMIAAESGAEFIAREETEEEAVSWETLIEELFEKKENAEAFLRALLSEADTENLYIMMNP